MMPVFHGLRERFALCWLRIIHSVLSLLLPSFTSPCLVSGHSSLFSAEGHIHNWGTPATGAHPQLGHQVGKGLPLMWRQHVPSWSRWRQLRAAAPLRQMGEGAAVEVGVCLNARQGKVPRKASISEGVHGDTLL